MTEFYDNLLKATSNIDDITTERYATVTKLNNNYCDVKEEDTGLEHTNVPILNGANLSVGDKVIIGFLNNSIYDTVCYGVLDRKIETISNWEDVKDKPSTFPPTPHNHISSEITDFPSIPSKTSDLVNDGDGSNVFVKDNDSRLSNARTPLDHTHLSSDVTDLIDVIYPVGSIYMSVSNVSPSTLFGGTWEQLKDKFLLASGDTYTAGNTGGEATHTLTIDEIPSHKHEASVLARYTVTGSANALAGYDSTTAHQNTSLVGGGQAHNNMPPYLVVNVWKRTA